MQIRCTFLSDPNLGPDWTKRDGHNRKNPVNAEFFHLKYARIIIKIQ